MAAPLLTLEGYGGLMAGALTAFANGANGSRVRLFRNNYFPTPETVWGDFLEANFPGYSPIVVPPAFDEGLTTDNIDVWRFSQVTFTMTATPQQVVYGYWIDFTNPLILLRQSIWCQRFDSPFIFTGSGSALPLTLTPGFKQG